ncbi:hypothetical protein [Halobacteriovorax sp. ZH4_bin.1]|uniref:hypothetical protein n=1 Tax=unclassified Halobacteriovorax TaxID=2639665 RepID=UPI00371C259C
MNILKFFTFFILSFTTAFAEDFLISSIPEKANVYIRNSANGQRRLLGETPYKGELSTVASTVGIDSTFVLEIEKSGYESYNLLVVRPAEGDIKIVASLKEHDRATNHITLDNVIIKLFDAQRFVRTKAYGEAVKALDSIENDASNLSSFYEMKGGALYLKKDFVGALANYRKATSLNEHNKDAFAMKQYLEKVLGEK